MARIGHEQDHRFVTAPGPVPSLFGHSRRLQTTAGLGDAVPVQQIGPSAECVLQPGGIGGEWRGDGVVADVRVNDRDQPVGPGIVRHELARGLLNPFLIVGGLSAEQEDDVLLLGNSRHGGSGMWLESRDGKEQAIAGLQPHTGPAVPGISQQQHIVLLFSAQSADDQKWIQQAAGKFVADNAGPNRLISIVYTDVCYNTISTPFTSDAARLQHALSTWPDLLHCNRVAELGSGLEPLYYAQIAKGLAQVPGHKVVVLFVPNAAPSAGAADQKLSELVPSPRKARGKSEKNAEPHQDPFDMELEFRKADISVYPVEAQAGVETPAWAVDLAEATGGYVLSRGSDGLGVFDPLTHQQDESYTLAYVPAASPEGSCHALKVTVNRPDVKVRGRNLYCNVPQVSVAAVKPKQNELESLAESAEAGNTAASATVPFFYEPNGVARVNMALEIPTPALEPTDMNGKTHAEMDVLGMAYIPGGDVVARFTHKLKFDFDTRQQFDDFLRHPLHYEQQFEVVPGNYQFKIIFRSAKDRFGAVEAPLAIDPFNNGQLSVSAIAFSRHVQPMTPEAAQEEAEAGKYPLIFRGNRIAVSGSDVLSKTGTAEAYFEIYEPLASAAGTVQLTMRLRLLNAQSNEPASTPAMSIERSG